MAFKTRVLVVANQTADSEGLAEALRRRAESGDVTFTLLVPATRQGSGAFSGFSGARAQLRAGLERLKATGLEVEGVVGDPDPVYAVHEMWNPGAFDEVIVSTLSGEHSRWLEYDLPHRIAKLTDCRVDHVVPSEIERELARENLRRPLKPAPQRALGPFLGPRT
jgi:hypothetical protein